MEKFEITINGKKVTATSNQTILEVVNEHKLDSIPTLCHSPELEPYGSCFLCVVEVKGKSNLVPSCATRVFPNMEVTTKNERITKSRQSALELLLSNHYADCVAPCSQKCPANVDIQGYIALCAMGLYKEAVNLVRKANPLPAICGRVCVRKCEEKCRRSIIDEPVGINNLKRYLTDVPGVYDDHPERLKNTGKKVAVVGAGPSGLTAAYYLGLWGHEVVLFEAEEQAGGMLRYGIPEYRLPKKILDKEIAFITKASGAVIKTQHRVGKDVVLSDLKNKFNAVYIAAGASSSNAMGVEGEFDTQGVVQGIEFLNEKTNNRTPIEGTVVVIGGGNTAMDAARVSWRLGAEKVILLYRRTKAEMPADPMEVEACIHEGIEIIELAAPVGIVKNEDGSLKALRCVRMVLGEPDSSGRRRPVPQAGSDFDLPCEMAISAIGQKPVLGGIIEVGDGIKKSRWDTIIINSKTMETNISGFWAGGDVADDGPTIVIDAIADGRKAAISIHKYLGGDFTEVEKINVNREFFAKPTRNELGKVNESPRHNVEEISPAERKNNFTEVALGYEHEDAAHECERCLSCGCFVATDCALRQYATDYSVDMKRFSGAIRKHKIDDRHPYIIYDPNKCILCAKCVRTCAKVLSTSAIGLINRGFKTEMRPAMSDPLVETNCVSCGNCIEACPTGALTQKLPFPGRADVFTEEVASRCGFCAMACATKVRSYGEGRYNVSSSGKPGEYLCRFGRFGSELFIKQPRITSPLIKRNGRLETASLNEVTQNIVESFKRISEKYGQESIGVFVSPQLTNEVLFVAEKIAREGINTNNLASLSILETGSDFHSLDKSFGFTGSTSDRSSLKEADLIICNNTDPEFDYMVLSADIVQAHQRGAKVIVCSSTVSSLTKIASVHLDAVRGSSNLLWNAVIQNLINNGNFDRKIISKIEGGKEFLDDKYDYNLDHLEQKTRVEKERIFEATSLILKSKKIVFIHSPDRASERSSGDIETIANLAVLLNCHGKESEILMPTSCSNYIGSMIFGIEPKNEYSQLKGARNLDDMRKLLSEGKIKAALILGEDPMRDVRVGSYFNSCEFMAVLDSTFTETVNFADAVLPASTSLETAGTRVNFEGKLNTFAKSVESPSRLTNLEILFSLASAFRLNLKSSEVEKSVKDSVLAFNEIRKSWKTVSRLLIAKVDVTSMPDFTPLTRLGAYRREVRIIGDDRFRVN